MGIGNRAQKKFRVQIKRYDKIEIVFIEMKFLLLNETLIKI